MSLCKSNPLLITAAALVTISAAGMTMLHAKKDPFEGSWKIKAEPEANNVKAFEESLTFKGMKMTAAGLAKKDWPTQDYDDDLRQGGIATFTCTLKNEKLGEEMKWSGTVSATELRGTIVWKHKGGAEDNYNFTGSKQ